MLQIISFRSDHSQAIGLTVPLEQGWLLCIPRVQMRLAWTFNMARTRFFVTQVRTQHWLLDV